MFRFALLVSPIVLIAACDGDVVDTDNEGTDDATERVARVVVSTDGDVGAVVDSHNAFAWDLYAELADDDSDNIFFSPFSTTAALSMTYAGAEQATQSEMEDVLNVDIAEADWHTAMGAYIQDLNGDLGRGYTLNIANQLFGQTGYPFEQPFLDVCEQDYAAPLEDWDFISDAEGGRERVNTWVEDNTNDRIVDLLPQGAVDDGTRLILANAIYFLADWETPFDPEQTEDGTFTRLDASTVTVPLMFLDTEERDEHNIETGWVDDVSVARMPYQDGEVSMVLLVPDAADGLTALESGLDAATYATYLGALGSGGIVVMPRIEMEYEVELKQPMSDLGMASAFDGGTADFTGMADPTAGRLYIDGIYHKAFVSIDEYGTEAAAATAVVVNTDSAPPMVRADHPFLFLIQDDLTGAILFVGRVTDPS